MMKIFGKDKEEKKRRPVHCCPYAHRDRFLHFTKLKKAWKESKTKRKEKRYLHHMLLPRSTATLPNARAWDVAKPSFNPTPKNTNSFGNLFYISENNCQCFFFFLHSIKANIYRCSYLLNLLPSLAGWHQLGLNFHGCKSQPNLYRTLR